MNAPTQRHRFALDLSLRGYQVLFHRDETNRCPGCGKAQWLVGRITAECVSCGTALPLAEAQHEGFHTPAQKAVALHLVHTEPGESRGQEKRRDKRSPASGRVLALHLDGSPHAFSIHNISAGGVMGEMLPDIAEARSIVVELEDGTLLPAEMKWTDGNMVGVAFVSTDAGPAT